MRKSEQRRRQTPMIAPAFFLVAFAAPNLLHAQPLPRGVDLDDPSSLVSDPTCFSECKSVYSDCRMQCGKDTTRAREKHLDLTNPVPEAECLDRCKSNLALCIQTCGSSLGK